MKINLTGPRKLTVAQKVENNGLEMARNEAGDIGLSLKFDRVNRQTFTRNDVEILIETLSMERNDDDSPAEVFRRTAKFEQDDEHGMVFTAQFSEEKRSRAVRIPDNQREGLVDLLHNLLDNMDSLTEQFKVTEAAKAARKAEIAAEKAAKAAKDAEGQAANPEA